MLEKRLEKIKKEGLDKYRERYQKNTQYLRKELAKIGFYPLAENPTNAVSAIYTEKYDAYEIVRILRDKHNIEIAPSGGNLKTKLFRVGNYGNIGKKEIKLFINKLKLTLKELEKWLEKKQ